VLFFLKQEMKICVPAQQASPRCKYLPSLENTKKRFQMKTFNKPKIKQIKRSNPKTVAKATRKARGGEVNQR
jgi:hypothetical protein